jgi:hypothetical protein
MQLVFKSNNGQFARAMAAIADPIKKAAVGAVADAGEYLLQHGRQSIAGAGFPGRWQTGFRVRLYPPQAGRGDLGGAAFSYHLLWFANVFERGARIAGKPLLWLPLPTAPLISGRPMTVKQYVRMIGPVRSIVVAGKPPMLGGYALGGVSSAGKLTLGKLRSGSALARLGVRDGRSARGRQLQVVPLFVGVNVVQLRKRYDIAGVADQARERLGEFYYRRLRAE